MSACFLRTLHLQLRLLTRHLGPMPPLLLAILIAGAHLQEPRFFRDQGLDITWPFIFGVADLWSGVVVLVCSAHRRSLIAIRLARACASVVFGITGLLVSFGVGVVLDLGAGIASPWAAIGELSARNVCLWLPISILAQSPLLPESLLPRWAAIAGAFALLTWSLPLGMSFAAADKILPSALALAGAVVTMTASEP